MPSPCLRSSVSVLSRPRRRLGGAAINMIARSSTNGGTGEEQEAGTHKQEEETKTPSDEVAGDFNIVAADSKASHSRRFLVSTGGNTTKASLFKDYTRKRYTSQYERETEHTTFVAYLPKQVHELESEGAHLIKNPLIRDQHNVVIDKNDATNRRWLTGGDEQAAGGTSVFDRQRQGQTARLSGAHDAVLRKKAGLWSRDGDIGVPEEGMSVEQKIQLAMAQGDFDNLKNKGKPLERLSEGQYFEDRSSHMFMDALAKTGVKPVWVERSSKIKEMQAMIIRRLTAEWARMLLQEAGEEGEGEGREAAAGGMRDEDLRRMRRRWEDWAHSAPSIVDDVKYLNDEIDLYNIQVPSMNLQRIRLKTEYLLNGAYDDARDAFLGGGGGGGGKEGTWSVKRDAARSFVRKADREGIMGPITCLATFRLDEEDDLTRQRRVTQSDEASRQGNGSRSSSGSTSTGSSSGGGVLDVLTSLFSSGWGRSGKT